MTPPQNRPPMTSKQKVVTQEMDLTDETATTQSQMSKSHATTQNKLAEMEAALRRQQWQSQKIR